MYMQIITREQPYSMYSTSIGTLLINVSYLDLDFVYITRLLYTVHISACLDSTLLYWRHINIILLYVHRYLHTYIYTTCFGRKKKKKEKKGIDAHSTDIHTVCIYKSTRAKKRVCRTTPLWANNANFPVGYP